MASAHGFSKHLLGLDIFKTQEEEQGYLRRTGSKDGANLKARLNQVCTRGTDLFIAVGNTIRCVDTAKKESSGYKKLNADVDFEILGLVANSAGTLLAVVGLRKVLVCVLPPTISGTDNLVKVNCREVGCDVADEGASILKVAWNPIARYDSNLVILTSDLNLRAYDLSLSYSEPEATFSFHEDDLDTYGLDTEAIENPVSFAFGSDSEPHGKLTLYILTQDSDIFGICPWMPNQTVLAKEEIEDIFDHAISKEYECRQNKDASNDLKRHYKKQLSWATQIWKQSSSSMVETKLARDGSLFDLHIIKRPDIAVQLVQGPFTLSPYPNELYVGDALDITSLNIGSMTTLAVSSSNGGVTFFLQDTCLDVLVHGSTITPNIELATIESVSLGGNDLGLYRDDSQDLCIFAVGSRALWRLDISPWAVPLNNAVDSGSLQDVQKVLSDKLVTIFTNLMDKQDKSKVKGMGIIEDEIGNQYSLVKTEFGLWINQWTESEHVPEAQSAVHELNNRNADTIFTDNSRALESGLNYESLLDKSVNAQVTQILREVQHSYPNRDLDIAETERIEPTLEHLEFFIEIANFYTEQLGRVQKAGYLLHTRVGSQKSELHRQLKKIGDLSRKLGALQENSQSDAVQAAVDRQEELQNRALKLLQRVASSKQLLLSDQEKRWIMELKRLQQNVYNANGFDKRIKNAVAQARIILNEVQLLDKKEKKNPEYLEPESISRLEALLAKESEVIDSTKSQLERLVSETKLLEQVNGLSI